MTSQENDEPTRYAVILSDPALEEFEQAYLWRSSVTSPEAATRWAKDLRAAINDLERFPRRFQRASEYEASRGDVRRLLHSGYRILYLVIEPDADEETGIVRVLHIYHGARNTY